MTLALPKTGLRPAATGRLLLADIGIPQATYERIGLAYQPPFGGRYRVPLAVQGMEFPEPSGPGRHQG